MKAVDTNVLARLILADDPVQHSVALEVLANPVWISLSVWLELGWVLNKRLKPDRGAVANALSDLLMIETVNTSETAGIRWAIDRYRVGADWGDMIYIVAARGIADAFVTFDRTIARQAGDAAPLPIETLA